MRYLLVFVLTFIQVFIFSKYFNIEFSMNLILTSGIINALFVLIGSEIKI